MIINDRRALAYIATVTDVRPLEGYDRVEYSQVNGGWWCITKKDEVKVGDKAIYFEIDSKVPNTDERFAFLENKKYKIKTQKMCGVYSQGLIMPLTMFPELGDLEVGTDVTETLGITYYVPEDNKRKSNNSDDKYKSMAQRHKNLFKRKPFRWLMRREWGRKLLFIFFGKKRDKPKSFPTGFPYVHKTDEERCLFRNEKILTDKGLIRIADIVNKKLDVKVKSFNFSTNEFEWKKILSYQKYPAEKYMLKIEFPYRVGSYKSNNIICTKDHRLYTDKGYKKASELTLDDNLYIHSYTYDKEIIPYLYGHILGDGHLAFDSRNKSGKCNFSFTQGQTHIEYIKLLKYIYCSTELTESNSGYKPENKIYKFRLNDLDILNLYLQKDKCINNKKFHITQEFCNRLTDISLALWYLDDGSCSFDENGKLKKAPGFASCAFSEEENKLLILWLKEKYDIDANLHREKDKYWCISILKHSADKFFNIIKDYIPEDMKYKVPDKYRNISCKLGNIHFEPKWQLLPIPIRKIEEVCKYKNLELSYVYDLEIEDNHNFIASNILNHNCENMPYILENKNPFVVTEKLDGTSCTYILERKKFGKFEFYVSSRNVRQLNPEQECYHESNIYWELAKKYDIENKLKDILINNPELKYVCIQGEGVGSVQGNPLKLEENDLYVFNFITSDVGRWPSTTGKELVETLGFKWVPILDENYTLPDDLEEFKLYADGKSVVNPNVLREGLVLRDKEGKISFKNISREYLLKKK